MMTNLLLVLLVLIAVLLAVGLYGLRRVTTGLHKGDNATADALAQLAADINIERYELARRLDHLIELEAEKQKTRQSGRELLREAIKARAERTAVKGKV